MLDWESLQLLASGALIGLASGWLLGPIWTNRAGSVSKRASSGSAEHQRQPGQAELDQPRRPAPPPKPDGLSSVNRLARMQAIRDGRATYGPRGEELYMVASECIVFKGTKDECCDFLAERGVIPFETAVEPLDLRIEGNLAVLGVGVIDYWGPEPSPEDRCTSDAGTDSVE